jgi:hypothetical protein
MSESEQIQCPCGKVIVNTNDYKVLFLKRELKEIDVLCPNESCYLRELGYIRFDVKNKKAIFKEASFYPPLVTWNAGRLGWEKAEKLLKAHLKAISKGLDWKSLTEKKEKKK